MAIESKTARACCFRICYQLKGGAAKPDSKASQAGSPSRAAHLQGLDEHLTLLRIGPAVGSLIRKLHVKAAAQQIKLGCLRMGDGQAAGFGYLTLMRARSGDPQSISRLLMRLLEHCAPSAVCVARQKFASSAFAAASGTTRAACACHNLCYTHKYTSSCAHLFANLVARSLSSLTGWELPFRSWEFCSREALTFDAL